MKTKISLYIHECAWGLAHSKFASGSVMTFHKWCYTAKFLRICWPNKYKAYQETNLN